jgi:hypothetical protein
MSWLRAAPRLKWFRALFFPVAASLLLGSVQVAPGTSALPRLPQGDAPSTADTGLPPSCDSPAQDRATLFARLGVDWWHQAGHQGRGLKIAILDSGFRDYRSFLGKVLPTRVTVQSFRADGNLEARDSQHGILCGEVAHAIAPDADLLFANWDTDRPETFLQAIRWAKEQGAKVLSCSLIMPSWSDGEGGGAINAAVARIVGSGQGTDSILFFASAGNTAQRHWRGSLLRDPAGFHQWEEGHRNNTVTPWGTERVSVELYGVGCANLELLVYESVTGKPVGRCLASCSTSACRCPCAAVRFQPQADARYSVQVRCDRAAKPDKNCPFHLVVLGGSLHYTTVCGSIPCPADGPGALAVGAVDSEGQRLCYSSCGLNRNCMKPDFMAHVPFPSAWRERPFAGTSAAAPQAAALAALVWAAHPTWTADNVSKYLRQNARDLGPKGNDRNMGQGLLALPRPE